MDITPLVRSDLLLVQAYKGGAFRISGKRYSGHVILLNNQVFSWDCPETVASLTADHFSQIVSFAEDVDVLLFGTGAQMQFFPPALRDDLRQKGLVADVMDTGAACRTYNVLAAEGRRVAAALLST